MGEVVGIVLGAGASTRLGRPKQLLGFGDTTLLGHVVRDVEASDELDRVIVVERDATKNNDDRTCSTSIRAGLNAAGACDAIVLLLGDMPGVTPSVINHVVSTWRETRPWAAVTEYRDGVGHPFVFSSATFDELRALHGDKAVWKIVDREPPERVVRIPIDVALPRDVDTWDDYVAICATFGVAPDSRRDEATTEVYPPA